MKPSVVLLTTGETVVTNLQEVFRGEGEDKKGLCLLLNHPYKLDLIASEEDSTNVQVKFTKWMPFSGEIQFKIPYDTVITIGEPEQSLKEAFERKVKAAEEKIEAAKKAKEEEHQPIYASDVSIAGVGMGFGS